MNTSFHTLHRSVLRLCHRSVWKIAVVTALWVGACMPGAHGADYVAHEWGTFTSVQGADGQQIVWNPYQTWDLPNFVYRPTKPDGRTNGPSALLLASKGKTAAKQRMETPVIYFYADVPLTVRADVGFPEGVITEWFPQASAFGPRPKLDRDTQGTNHLRSFIEWADVQVRASATRTEDLLLLPSVPETHHYGAARATEANLLQVRGVGANGPVTETEGFLFYRGLGDFDAPLHVEMDANERFVHVHNKGAAMLASLVLVEVDGNQGRFEALGNLEADEKKNVSVRNPDWLPLQVMETQLVKRLESALMEAGLYAMEARAMVQTWRDAWLGDQGLRILYLLPSSWTESVLPLTLQPKPSELVRVMIGRAEILTPSMEWDLLRAIVHYADAENDAARWKAVAAVRGMGLNRFGDPLLRRILGSRPEPTFRSAAHDLVRAANRPADATTVLGARLEP